MKKGQSNVLRTSLAVTLLAGSLAGGSGAAAAANLAPQKPVWGNFLEHYKANVKENSTVNSNPAIGVLSEYEKLWTPGEAWDNGTIIHKEVLDANIQKVVEITTTRTPAEAEAAYYDDRRHQSYSVIDGLGPWAEVYRDKAGAVTTITSIPADAVSTKYDDKGTGAGAEDSSLGHMVKLVNTLRGPSSSSNPSKNYYKYPRPFRWSEEVNVLPTLVPAKNPDPSQDGGFPSGHTNAAYLAGYALAYAVPERYQELLTRASELGNSRIVAGMHSPLDVMGGRVMSTALAASILNDPDNASLKQAAYQEARQLLAEAGTGQDLYRDKSANEKAFAERLTYDFPMIGETGREAVVPLGAEVLLETRLPYLSGDERRSVLATTSIPSGYPLLDDAEGWGRLNLYAAADGYGAFKKRVTVTMDASKGGFHAEDTWRNDIAGSGSLIKRGSGTLRLTGNNTYTGSTVIEQGQLEAGSKTALGKGAVWNKGGALAKEVQGEFAVSGNFTQSKQGVLELTLSSSQDVLRIQGKGTYYGKLQLNFKDGYIPAGTTTIIQDADPGKHGKFTSVEVSGLPKGYRAELSYTGLQVQLKVIKK